MNSISGILSAASLLGVLLFLAGVGLAVSAVSQNRSPRGGAVLAVAGIIIAALLSVVAGGLLVVEPTQVAIVTNTFTGQVEEPKRAGTHIIVPIFQRVVIFYPITQQEYTMAATLAEGASRGDDAIVAQTKDGQTIGLDVTVIFRVNPDEADNLYLRWNENYLVGFVRPTVRSLVREQVTGFTAEEIYSALREKLANDIEAVVETRFVKEHLELTDLLIRDITFSDAFTNAIEEKVVAEQNLARARTEAERARTEAQGRANAAIAAATGEAESIILRATAEAEALRVVSEEIAKNPMLIQYLYVQNLSDNVSIALVPSNTPFLFDLGGLLSTTQP